MRKGGARGRFDSIGERSCAAEAYKVAGLEVVLNGLIEIQSCFCGREFGADRLSVKEKQLGEPAVTM